MNNSPPLTFCFYYLFHILFSTIISTNLSYNLCCFFQQLHWRQNVTFICMNWIHYLAKKTNFKISFLFHIRIERNIKCWEKNRVTCCFLANVSKTFKTKNIVEYKKRIEKKVCMLGVLWQQIEFSTEKSFRNAFFWLRFFNFLCGCIFGNDYL